MEKEKEKTDSWAAFGSEYLKAIDVLNDTDEYVITNVTSKTETNNNVTKDVLHLHVERNEFKKIFGCNATNTQAVQLECRNSPKDAIGRRITWNKVRVTRPGSDEVVDGLRIQFVKEGIPEVKVDSGIADDGTI